MTSLCAELDPGSSGEPNSRVLHQLKLDLDSFTHEALEREAARLGITVEELARFAVLYYLADHDSGRIARRLPVLPSTDQPQPHPLGELLDS